MYKRSWITKSLIVLLLGTIGVAACAAPATNSEASVERTAAVKRGTIRASVSASGKIDPAAQVNLNFGVPGTVKAVLVDEGELVKAGDVIAELDTDDLQLAVKQAEQAVATQKLAYTQAISPTAGDVKAAEAAIASASASLNQLSKPDEIALQIARLQADSANESKRQVEFQWDQIKDKPVGGMPRDMMQSQLAQATMAAQIAELQYQNVKRGGNTAQLAGARAQLVQAQAQLQRLLGNDLTRGLAEAQLKQAELNLEAARQRLTDAVLTSPIDGTVAQLNVKVGEQVGVSGLRSAAVVSDLSSFHIDIGIDENSIGVLQEQQPVVITIDALPDETLTGRVDYIAPTASDNAGVVTYKVIISLDETNQPVRGGMSANADVITEVRDNVLIVPNWTIRIDRQTGKAYVYTQRGDKVEEIEIVTGLRNANESEVTAGLNEGDVLVVPQKSGFFGTQ
ncbi:Leukotoxin export protein LtxD [Thermoflexales bacterium]|nr:Leukotoxin export protein LtxD [Thermoflexales bacterium]